MIEWKFVFTNDADRDLEKLDTQIRKRILERLKWLKENFVILTPMALTSEWQGFLKFKIGDWRIVYEVDYEKKLVIIHLIDHRSKIYHRKIPKSIK